MKKNNKYELSPEPKKNTRQRAAIGRKEFAEKLNLKSTKNQALSISQLEEGLKNNPLTCESFYTSIRELPVSRKHHKKGGKK